MRIVPVVAATLLAALALAGCDTFFGESEGPPLPGERISVLSLNRAMTADPSLSDLRVRLPQPYSNSDWPQSGGYTTHAMYHLAAGEGLNTAWSAKVGSGADDDRFLLADPVVGGGRIYTMDAGATITAFDAKTGTQVWRVDLTPEDEDDDLFGGGLAFDDGKLYVTTPFALAFALDATSGAELWRASTPGPMRAPPTVSGGRVFVITLDNQLFALAADDGRRLWSYAAIAEDAGLLGGAAPAVAGDNVVAAFSSGEIIAFRAETGRLLWGDSLAGVARGDAIATLADIRGMPVIDRNVVVAVSNSGTLAAIDLTRGGRLWTANVGSAQTPWVAGDFIYVLTNDAELICLTRQDGRVRWVQGLPQFEDPQDKEKPLYWSGPILVGDRLIITNSAGDAVSASPYTGQLLGRIQLPGRSHLPPVVAGDTVYFLSDDAVLTALR
jgi:outer membrane protein assembly factor BamB